mgnify:CR=1 FL=1
MNPVPENTLPDRARFKLAALIEVLGLFLVGSFLGARVEAWLGVKPLDVLLQTGLKANPPDWIALSGGWMQTMGIHYACLLVPAWMVGRLRRRPSAGDHDRATVRQSLARLSGVGLIVFSCAGLGLVALTVTRRLLPLGPHPSFLTPYLAQDWTPSFWIFLLVASMVVQPLLEELFFRGYCQRRFEEAFGGPGAIIIVSLFVTLAHDQYHHPTVGAAVIMAAVILLNLGIGYAYWHSRSLVPAMLVHGLANVPTKGIYDFLLPAAMLAVLAISRDTWVTPLRDYCTALARAARQKVIWAVSLIAILAAIGIERAPRSFAILGAIGLALALGSKIPRRDGERL